jgi:hypothetical protein
MMASLGLTQDPIQINPPPLISKVELHGIREARFDDARMECGALLAPSAIMHFERRPTVSQLLGHAEDRRHSNPAGQQDHPLSGLLQRKIVTRLANLDHISDRNALDQSNTASPRFSLAQNANQVAGSFLWVIAQRVLSNESWLYLDIDMGSGTERQQWLTFHRDEFETGDTVRFRRLGVDFNHPHKLSHDPRKRPIPFLQRINAAPLTDGYWHRPSVTVIENLRY